MTTYNLANDGSYIEHKQRSGVSHDGFVHELLHSAAYSFVQSPLEGAAQLIDHTAGKAIHSNLYKNCKDAIVSAPKQAAFASPEWHGQALGSAIGILPWFTATKGALKSIAPKSFLSSSIMAADEVALNSGIFSRNTAKLALEGGVSGAAFAGVFKPVDYKGSESNFWSAKAASMATDFATFATLNASSLAISKSITSAAAPLMERSNLAAKTIPYVSMFAAGAGSGIPAAAVEMTTGAVLSNGNTNFGSRDFLQNAYSYAFVGGALSGLHTTRPESKNASKATLMSWDPLAKMTPEEKDGFVKLLTAGNSKQKQYETALDRQINKPEYPQDLVHRLKEFGISDECIEHVGYFQQGGYLLKSMDTLLTDNKNFLGGKVLAPLVAEFNDLGRKRAQAIDFNLEWIELEKKVSVLHSKYPDLVNKITDMNLDLHSLVRIIRPLKNDEAAERLNSIVEKGWFSEKYPIDRFHRLEQLVATAKLSKAEAEHLISLNPRYGELNSTLALLEENPEAAQYIKKKLEDHSARRELKPQVIADRTYKLFGFDESEQQKLKELGENQLSLLQVSNYLAERPENITAVRQLLSENASVKQFKDFLKLSVFAPQEALQLSRASWEGQVRLEDIIGGLRDYKHGHAFYLLLKDHLCQERPINKEEITRLKTESQAADTAVYGPHMKKVDAQKVMQAQAFTEAADSITKKIGKEQPIVLLGRDAWPLVPILRERGHNAMYFLYSRLQHSDEKTRQQWLKEIPPGAAVVDTGYSGSIINAIKEFDPSITGYLLSTSGKRYTRLLDDDHSLKVSMIEGLPKLIYRTVRHNDNGNAVSRRKSIASDSDTASSPEQNLRWWAEASARRLLSHADMPDWTTWRYSTFVGLTPAERLGVSTPEEVAKHYESVLEARKTARIKNDSILTRWLNFWRARKTETAQTA